MTQTQALATKDKGEVEYVPFGAQDRIKLSVKIVQSLVAVRTKSGQACSDADAVKFIAMCQARRLNPFEGDAFLIGFDGKDGPQFNLITSHQAFLKRAELHPEFDGLMSGVIIEPPNQCTPCKGTGIIETKLCPLCKGSGALDQIEGDLVPKSKQVIGGWATVLFKNRTESMRKRLDISKFNKGFGIWRDNPAGMIVKCAEADALRSAFPTMLGGLYMQEEIVQEKPAIQSTSLLSSIPAQPTTAEPVPAATERPVLPREEVRAHPAPEQAPAPSAPPAAQRTQAAPPAAPKKKKAASRRLTAEEMAKENEAYLAQLRNGKAQQEPEPQPEQEDSMFPEE